MALTLETFFASLPVFEAAGAVSTGTVEWIDLGTAGDTIAVGGLEFVAVAGARAAGSLTWSVDGTASAQASSFVAMVNDSEAADALLAVKVTPTKVKLTTIAHGYESELYFATSDAAVYTLSGATLTGGSALATFYLGVSASMINVAVWKTKAISGQTFLLAHFLAVATGIGGGELGVVTSRGMDRISQGNAATSFDPSDAALASSKWGRQYLALRRTVFVLGATTGARGCG